MVGFFASSEITASRSHPQLGKRLMASERSSLFPPHFSPARPSIPLEIRRAVENRFGFSVSQAGGYDDISKNRAWPLQDCMRSDIERKSREERTAINKVEAARRLHYLTFIQKEKALSAMY